MPCMCICPYHTHTKIAPGVTVFDWLFSCCFAADAWHVLGPGGAGQRHRWRQAGAELVRTLCVRSWHAPTTFRIVRYCSMLCLQCIYRVWLWLLGVASAMAKPDSASSLVVLHNDGISWQLELANCLFSLMLLRQPDRALACSHRQHASC